MTNFISRLPYRKKIRFAITATSALILFICASLFTGYQLISIRHIIADKANNIAKVLAANITVAVTRDDVLFATRELASLKTVTDIREAYVFLPNGNTFASYNRIGDHNYLDPPHPSSNGTTISLTSLQHIQPLTTSDKEVGRILLVFVPDLLNDQLQIAAISLFIGTIIALAISYIVSVKIEPFISSPIFELSAIANTIAHKKDYSLRANLRSQDEIGQLANSINSMLSQIEKSDNMLKRHKQDLELLISERTKKLSRANTALIESEKKLRLIADNLPVLICYSDTNLCLTFHNSAYLSWFQRPFPTHGIVTLGDAYGEDNIVPVLQALPALLHGEPQQISTKFTLNEGDMRFVEVTAIPHCEEFQVVKGFILLVRDETTQREAERKLRQSKESAEENAKLKSDFVANISHELRTPINGVIGAAELAMLTNLDDEQKDYIEIIRSSSEGLLRLVNDVLNFSAIESATITLNTREFALLPFLKKTLSLIEISARDKEVKISLSVDEMLPDVVYCDSDRLRQILFNLLGNAIKFTPPHGEVTLCAAPDGNKVLFSVTDTGIGIEESVQHKIFSPFFQADSSSTRSFGGTGLGLAIAANLVTRMGGYLDVDSQPGKGSTFYFAIDLPETPQSSCILERQITQAETFIAPSPTPIKALLVEDNLVNQKVAIKILQKLNIEVELAVNGLEALEKAEINTFDIIFMDCQMPVMDGFEATKNIHRLYESQNRYTPIIALTAHALAGDEEKCLLHGMDGYLSKPIDINALKKVLKKFTQNKCS
ncbi:MAG: ATP-binding protein [bacterium]|nr:ATP-binding protein [bacterium]